MCDVTEIKPVAGDLDRLERELKSLAAKDLRREKRGPQWAERRARGLQGQGAPRSARTIEGEALRIESEMKRLGVDAPREWLAMAKEARRPRSARARAFGPGPPRAASQAGRRDHRRRVDDRDQGNR